MKVKFFSLRPFEENHLRNANSKHHEISFETTSLSIENVALAEGYETISVFTNDDLSKSVLQELKLKGIRYIAIRATGYDQVDLEYAFQNEMAVANVPEYSPYAIAEHAVALMLALNRKIILSDKQVKQYNFSLNNLIGFDMHEKTVGIIGMGKIGGSVAKILNGFGCKIMAYDVVHNPFWVEKYGVTYCSKEEIFTKADIITLHCPLNDQTRYTINKQSIVLMKTGVMIINCGRGGLVNTEEVIEGLETKKIGYLGIDVYEKEKGVFFFDHSSEKLTDPILLKLMTFDNVIITPHQAFLTSTALKNIADTTFYNIDCWAKGDKSKNELYMNSPG
ncbi:MAG TPA: 2-hydroxyacid dehydrogenase [Cytophagaceae bacterium]|jgi:D-lactate dehydrogenase|nr:2-hydroxyacid dehydrogenase [Cytophagaceae bacterium]